MASATQFRVWGGLLSGTVPYLDMDLVGIDDENGDLYFEATGSTTFSGWQGGSFSDDGSATQTVDVSTFNDLVADGMIVNRTTMPGTGQPVWDALDALQTQRNAVASNEEATSRLDKSMQFIFRAIAQFS